MNKDWFNWIKLQVDSYARVNSLFDSESGYNEYIVKLTEEEKKNFITINIIAGKDLFDGVFDLENETKKVEEIDSDVFKNIVVYYCPYVSDSYQYINFKDERKTEPSFDVYKPYLDTIADAKNHYAGFEEFTEKIKND